VRLCVFVYTVCLVFVCVVFTSTRCVVCLCVLHLHDVFSCCVFCTYPLCSVICVPYTHNVFRACVFCTWWMCSVFLFCAPTHCFNTSLLEIEALCEIQFRNLQRTFAPLRYALHGGPCNSIDVLSSARFFQGCLNHGVDTAVLGVVLKCAVWLRKEEADCSVNYINKWETYWSEARLSGSPSSPSPSLWRVFVQVWYQLIMSTRWSPILIILVLRELMQPKGQTMLQVDLCKLMQPKGQTMLQVDLCKTLFCDHIHNKQRDSKFYSDSAAKYTPSGFSLVFNLLSPSWGASSPLCCRITITS